MAAVIRVKRLLEEEPAEALLLNCKRLKVDETLKESDQNELSTVWKFAGTLKSQEEDVLKHISNKKPTAEEAKEQYKKHIFNVNEKVREDVKNASKANRLKVVNCFRANKQAKEDSASEENVKSDEELTILDVEPTELEKTKSEENSEKYVYDLYYTNSDDFGELDINEYISVHPLSDDLIYGSKHDNGLSSESDSEDSNAENNWRNDYPDESDCESITEDDMIAAMNRVDLNKDYELSSDEGEEGFVYSIDSEAAGFEEDVDLSDVRRYGEMYARFKARNKNVETTNLESSSSFYYGDIDSEEYYY